MPFGLTDRRLRTRYKVRIPFTLKANGQEVRGMTRNISLLGISAYSSSSMSGATESVQCLLNLPETPAPLVAHGTVIRCEPLPEPHPDGSHEIGVFFKEFERDGEADLSRFLNRLMRQEQSAIQAGYKALKRRLADRKRRRRLQAEAKRKRKLLRLKKRRLRLLAKARRKKGRPGRPRTASKRRRRGSSRRAA